MDIQQRNVVSFAGFSYKTKKVKDELFLRPKEA